MATSASSAEYCVARSSGTRSKVTCDRPLPQTSPNVMGVWASTAGASSLRPLPPLPPSRAYEISIVSSNGVTRMPCRASTAMSYLRFCAILITDGSSRIAFSRSSVSLRGSWPATWPPAEEIAGTIGVPKRT